MHGLKTKWFVDVEKSGRMSLKAKGWEMDGEPKIVKEARSVDGIKRRFAGKYGEGQVKKYYPTSEVALELTL
jgi:hypothetical protein